jgi:hypothetical protein
MTSARGQLPPLAILHTLEEDRRDHSWRTLL